MADTAARPSSGSTLAYTAACSPKALAHVSSLAFAASSFSSFSKFSGVRDDVGSMFGGGGAAADFFFLGAMADFCSKQTRKNNSATALLRTKVCIMTGPACNSFRDQSK